MQLEKRIQAFVNLGYFMSQFSGKEYIKKENTPYNDDFFDGMIEIIQLSK